MEKIKINAIIEIAGKPAEHVDETIKKMIGILEKNEKIKIIKKEISKTKSIELPLPDNSDKKIEVFSSFADLELDFPNFDELMQFIYVFMPSSVEILEPKRLEINQKDIENSLNDLLGRLHEQSKILMEYEALRRTMASMNPNS